MSSSITTEKSLLSESQPTPLSSTMHREASMMQSWSLSITTMERSSFCTVQAVAGRHSFATPLLLLFAPKEKLLFVWHLQESHPSFLRVEEQLTLLLKSPCKLLRRLSVTSLETHMFFLSSMKPLSLYGMKSPCSTSMQ